MRGLARNDTGGALVEFAMVLPLILSLGFGMCEAAYQGYLQAVLTGSVQNAARASTLEGATTSTIDTAVLTAVRNINGQAAFAASYPQRKSYASFGYISPESFTDTNGNSARDAGECFTDINSNGTWDSDPGISGNGGAGDSVVYVVKVDYPRLFPLAQWLGWGRMASITASTVLKNQPWSGQASSTPATVCT